MKKLNNPFVVYGYAGPEYFCDREEETTQLINDLHNERNVALISPRRLGKSGLIHHVFNRLKTVEPETTCIYIDIMSTKNLRQFVNVVASKVIGALDSSAQSALRRAADFFRGLRPTMSFSQLDGTPEFSLTFDDSQTQATIESIFKYIADSGKRCYIAFDEFQQIREYPEQGSEAMLRSFIQTVPNVHFIFAGSRKHMMADMFLSPKQPFYLATTPMTLKEIDEQKYLEFVNSFFRKQGRSIDAETFHYLFSLVDGQTWYVQMLLNCLYDESSAVLDKHAVDDAAKNIINRQSAIFADIYADMTENQASVIVAIAKERMVSKPLAQTFIKKYALPAASSIKTVLKSLDDRQLIYKALDGYIVYDRFFAMWLRERL